jgi:cell division protein FtsL
MWRSVGLGVFLVAALIFFVWRQVELLQHGFEVSELRDERIAQENVNTHLRVTLESLRSPSRIEELAKSKLRMITPGPDETDVIERVIVDEAPDSSVLARR